MRWLTGTRWTARFTACGSIPAHTRVRPRHTVLRILGWVITGTKREMHFRNCALLVPEFRQGQDRRDVVPCRPASWTTTVRRILKESPRPAPQEAGAASDRLVTAKWPNHVRHIDLTAVPTGSGFWAPRLPFALPRCWPFCSWPAVVIDHVSRRAMGFAFFPERPDSAVFRRDCPLSRRQLKLEWLSATAPTSAKPGENTLQLYPLGVRLSLLSRKPREQLAGRTSLRSVRPPAWLAGRLRLENQQVRNGGAPVDILELAELL